MNRYCLTTTGAVLVAVASALGAISLAAADVNIGWDWELVGGKPKTSINVCTDPNLDKDMEAGKQEAEKIDWDWVVTQALTNWNNRAASTGWTFTQDPKKPCQVTIKAAGRNDRCDGGEKPMGTSPAKAVTPKWGRTDKVTICINKHYTGVRWGLSGTTGDPIRVVEHELGHSIRLDHPPNDIAGYQDRDNDPNTPDTAEIMHRAARRGDHDRELKRSDVDQAATSADLRLADKDGDGFTDVDYPVGPAGGSFPLWSPLPPPLARGCSGEIMIPPGALADTHIFRTTPVDTVSAPAIGRVPGGTEVVVGFRLGIDPPIAGAVEATFTIAYGCEVETKPTTGILIDSMPISAGPGTAGVPESALAPAVLGPLGDWDFSVPTSFHVDTAADAVTFTAPLLSTLYGVGGALGVGGIVELPVGQLDSPPSAAEGPDSSPPPYAAIAGSIAAAALALTAGAWYARRRRLG